MRRMLRGLVAVMVVGAVGLGAGCGSGGGGGGAGGGGSPELAKANETQTRAALKQFQVHFNLYSQEHEGFPKTIEEVLKTADPKYTFTDNRTGTPVLFEYIPPASNIDDTDVIAHTVRTGPLPILAVRLNGQVIDFATVKALDDFLDQQKDHPAPKAPKEYGDQEPGGRE